MSRRASSGPILASCLATLALCCSSLCAAATLEQDTAAKIELIRAIKAGQDGATMAKYNQDMDSAWKFYEAHKPAIFPVLRAQLKAEMQRSPPNDLVLLDVAMFLEDNDGANGKALAQDALFRLNARAPIMLENWKELFELAHGVAEAHDARLLDFADRTFLTSTEKVSIPQHALQLDPTLVCTFLYGAYGNEAEAHLRAKLKDGALSKRILEVLVWIGTPHSVQAVGDSLGATPNYETLSRVTAFMMQAGGPQGREFMLKLDSNTLDPKSREYLTKIRANIEAVSFDAIRKSLSSFPGEKKLADTELKARLEAMIANFGQDNRTSPLAVVDSGLPRDYLEGAMLTVRSRSFFRLSDEALSDVEVDNKILNALHYRAH